MYLFGTIGSSLNGKSPVGYEAGTGYSPEMPSQGDKGLVVINLPINAPKI
jgi:hypothetical protein